MARDIAGPTDFLDPPGSYRAISHVVVECRVASVCDVVVVRHRHQQLASECDWKDHLEAPSV